jgi:hypothetical protein
MIHKIANEEYKEKLADYVCEPDEYRDNISDLSYLDKIVKDESESYDQYSLDFALLILFENKVIPQEFKNLLKLAKDVYKFEIDKSSGIPNDYIDYKNLYQILTKNKQSLEYHANNFDIESSFIARLSSFTGFIRIDNEYSNTDQILKFLADNSNSSFVESYNTSLGTVLRPYIINALFKINVVKVLDLNSFKDEIVESTLKVKQELSQVRTDIVNEIAEFKELLEEDKDLGNYVKTLSKTLESLNLIDKITKETESHSLLMLFKIMLGQCKLVVINSKEFLNQLQTINQTIQQYKELVMKYQLQIDNYYNTPLTEKLYRFFKYTQRNEPTEYLWQKNFLKMTI